jgi:hypothetical protein
MDCRLEARMKAMVAELAREHAAELAAAGTLVDLEELTCQIGDEVTRSLTEQELVRRGQEQRGQPADCPDCGRYCVPMPDAEPVVLAGLRGSVAYAQPRHFCDRCRRSFFPSGRPLGDSSAKHGHNQSLAEGGLGRSQ